MLGLTPSMRSLLPNIFAFSEKVEITHDRNVLEYKYATEAGRKLNMKKNYQTTELEPEQFFILQNM